jgi:hypothetical protein
LYICKECRSGKSVFVFAGKCVYAKIKGQRKAKNLKSNDLWLSNFIYDCWYYYMLSVCCGQDLCHMCIVYSIILLKKFQERVFAHFALPKK